MNRNKLNVIVKGAVVAVGISIFSTCGNGIVVEAREDNEIRVSENVLNDEENMMVLSSRNIIGNTTVSVETMEKWARKKGATNTFISLAKKYVNLSKAHGGVNPVIAYAQSAVETGYGKFGGVLNESYRNPCGLKTKDGGSNTDPNAHQRFDSWDDGVSAHLDHLALYAGAAGYPRKDTKDPRHFSSIFGKAKTIEALSGTWATDTKYGPKITKLVNEIEELGGAVTPPVEPPKPIDPPVIPPVVSERMGIVTASALNVRQGMGTNTKVMGSLKRGAKVTIVETKNGWHKIKYGTGYGYVSADYINVSGGATNPEPSKPTPPPIVSGSKEGVVTASALNIRQGMGTNTKVIGSLKKGTKIIIVETKNGWHKIKHGSSYGYVSDDYVTIIGTDSGNSGAEKSGTVTASALNVRSGMGTNTKVVGSLKRGSKVIIVETRNGWHKIKYGNSYGYVSADYIR
ncbi:MAG: SH3 domain-containing protein [Clostridium sp.]|uniref:SH3 domain-containing protein n=1 Tax=Clostridium sp. TaxID=1506 RepID=UPI003EE45818